MAVRDPLEPPVHADQIERPAAAPPDTLEARIGHVFRDPSLLREALTHRSAPRGGRGGGLRRGAGSNERLEFIGDRVLGLVMAEWLLERFPDEQEGELGPRHARLVSRTVLAPIADALGLGAALSLAPDAQRAGVAALDNVRADALEALLGALFLDAGLDPVRRLVRAAWSDALTQHALPPKDPKTGLQEWLLARGAGLPAYEVTAREGPSHAPRFVVEVAALGVAGRGEAGSKRVAERDAAADLLARLQAGQHRKAKR
jgi:ribonuclease-3